MEEECMAKNRISLNEEDQKKLVRYYASALRDLGNETKKIIESFVKFAEKEHYNVVTDITNATIEFYAKDLKTIMQKNFDDWEQSNVSMHKIVEGTAAGQDAVGTANKLEKQLGQEINELFSNVRDTIKVNGSDGIIKPEDLEKMEAKIKKYISDINNLKIKHLAKIDKENEDNQLFGCIRGHVEATFNGAYVGYQQRALKVNGISQDLRSFMNSSNLQTQANNANMAKQSVTKAENTNSFPTFPFF